MPPRTTILRRRCRWHRLVSSAGQSVLPPVDDELRNINHEQIVESSKTTVATLMLMASSPSRLNDLKVERTGAAATVSWTPSPEKAVTSYIVVYGPKANPYPQARHRERGDGEARSGCGRRCRVGEGRERPGTGRVVLGDGSRPLVDSLRRAALLLQQVLRQVDDVFDPERLEEELRTQLGKAVERLVHVRARWNP